MRLSGLAPPEIGTVLSSVLAVTVATGATFDEANIADLDACTGAVIPLEAVGTPDKLVMVTRENGKQFVGVQTVEELAIQKKESSCERLHMCILCPDLQQHHCQHDGRYDAMLV